MKDCSDPTENTPSYSPTIRVCYLMPSDLNCVDKTEFMAEKYFFSPPQEVYNMDDGRIEMQDLHDISFATYVW